MGFHYFLSAISFSPKSSRNEVNLRPCFDSLEANTCWNQGAPFVRGYTNNPSKLSCPKIKVHMAYSIPPSPP
jgi:hypothetical protein